VKLVLLVLVSGVWKIICVHYQDDVSTIRKLSVRYSRIVTLESAREDYGVEVRP
jgi:hypothetical protein